MLDEQSVLQFPELSMLLSIQGMIDNRRQDKRDDNEEQRETPKERERVEARESLTESRKDSQYSSCSLVFDSRQWERSLTGPVSR